MHMISDLDYLPIYFDDSIGPELAAKILDTLSQLSLRITGHTLEIVSTPRSADRQTAVGTEVGR